jgi:outer membrane scaffolding protein for murein synthesis (MipA/OmpV family)
MKSASQMSQLIRAKKKKMMEDPDVIDSGGSPSKDLQDEVIDERDDMTKELGLDHNDPKDLFEKDNLQHMDDRQSNDDAGIEEKMLKRKARIKAMMSK